MHSWITHTAIHFTAHAIQNHDNCKHHPRSTPSTSSPGSGCTSNISSPWHCNCGCTTHVDWPLFWNSNIYSTKLLSKTSKHCAWKGASCSTGHTTWSTYTWQSQWQYHFMQCAKSKAHFFETPGVQSNMNVQTEAQHKGTLCRRFILEVGHNELHQGQT